MSPTCSQARSKERQKDCWRINYVVSTTNGVGENAYDIYGKKKFLLINRQRYVIVL